MLTSSQACVLPLEASGEVEFVPQIYSYQGRQDDPTVLMIVASNQGTSAHLLTGRQQKLMFNRGGKATKFLAKRLQQDRAERNVSLQGAMTSDETDRNSLFLVQIPLKQSPVISSSHMFSPVYQSATMNCSAAVSFSTFGDCQEQCRTKLKSKSRGMDHAMLRASDNIEGDFSDFKDKRLERDDRFPIRMTVQYYRVTDDPRLRSEDVADMATKITNIYKVGRSSGSLVTETTCRPTEPKLRDLTWPTSSALNRPMFAA